MNLLEAMQDPNLFGPWFKDRATWAAWTAFIAALFGLPMTPEQLAAYQLHTGRTMAPATPANEGWLVCGRRSGKTFVCALIAVYLACFRNYSPFLAPGEQVTIMLIALDRKQARSALRYVGGLLRGVPMLAQMIEAERADGFDLSNRVTIEITTATSKGTRGYTVAAAICDELAFWPTDTSAEPDYAVLDALRPSMATIPGAMLLCASSPHARRGALWDAYRKYYGQSDRDVLIWKAATREMNSTVPQRTIDAAIERDPAWAASEYLAEFRSDIAQFLSREAVEACVSPGVFERAPIANVAYRAGVDPSGGSGDSMTLAIGHLENGVAIIDAIRERKPPFKPDAVVAEFAELLKSYRVASVCGDRYGGEWPRDAFKRHGIDYQPSPKPKSDLYLEMLPRINSGQVDLLDHGKLAAQLLSLERRTARGGKDSIDHPQGAGHHDDVSNAVAMATYLLQAVQPMTFVPAVEWTKSGGGYPDYYGTPSSNPSFSGLDMWGKFPG
jgi:hypothetical protein